jgi:ribonuclease VapC
MFVDASAWTAILANEPERDAFTFKLLSAPAIFTSPLANWETARAVARLLDGDFAEIATWIRDYQNDVGARTVTIGDLEQVAAFEAHVRFGKGRHPASLNMGDCFAYACARTNGVPLLFKGGDFALTDIEPA